MTVAELAAKAADSSPGKELWKFHITSALLARLSEDRSVISDALRESAQPGRPMAAQGRAMAEAEFDDMELAERKQLIDSVASYHIDAIFIATHRLVAGAAVLGLEADEVDPEAIVLAVAGGATWKTQASA